MTLVSWVRLMRALGPGTSPTACALAGRRCSPWGWRKGVPGGGAFHRCEGHLRSGSPPPPTARPPGGPLGSATHVLWVRVCGCGGPTLSPWLACPVGAACRGGGGGPSRGGCPATVVRGVWCQTLSLPRPPVLWGRQPGFRDPCVPGAVRAGVGTQHRPWGWRKGVPGGGAVRRCEGHLGSGAPPLPAARPLGGLPGPTNHRLWVWGGAGVGTRQQPHSARSCVLWGRQEGSRGGAPPAWVWGVRGRALSHPRLPALWAGCRRPTTHWLWVRGGMGVGTLHHPHSARSCVLWGRHEGARGGRFLPGYGASGVGRSPTPDCPPSGRAAGATYPLGVGAGGCGRGDPSPDPEHALLRAGFARCGGGIGVPGGGASCLHLGRPGSGVLPTLTARPLSGLPGPTTHWLWVPGGAGVGTRHQPHSARSCVLWGQHEGAREGASCLGVGRPGSGALPTPTARSLGGLPGPATNWLWVRGGAGVGTRHQPHSARSCALWGRQEGARGGRSLPGCGASGVRRSPTSDCPPSGGVAGAHYPLAMGAGGRGRGDPSPAPQRELLQAGFVRCGGGLRAPGGGASSLGVGRPGSGALPGQTACLLGGLPGSTTHWLWVRGGAGVGTRHQPHSARSCVLWGWHVCAWGVRLLPGCGASGVGRSPTPDCPPSRRAAGAHYPLVVGAGGCGRGDPPTIPQRALLRAGCARCGGGSSCLGVGRPGSGALPPPTARPLGGLPGPTTHWLWVRGGAGVATRQQSHSARSCELAVRAVGAAAPAWVWGVRSRALSHPRLPAFWAGCRGPLP